MTSSLMGENLNGVAVRNGYRYETVASDLLTDHVHLRANREDHSRSAYYSLLSLISALSGISDPAH
jgi:hypothetical protein